MKIQCQTCQAKYTIADDKVLGKVVKIRCKKCSATIVINGNEARPAEENGDTHVFDYAAGANEQWTVNVADGDQRTMTPAEIAAEYKTGAINDETYCWKDGMADWLPLREIEQLYGAVKLGPRPSLADVDVGFPAPSAPGGALAGGGLFGGGAEPAPTGESPFAGTPAPTPSPAPAAGGPLFGGGAMAAAADPAPAAARRRGGHGQGADLFGKAATAGAEDDVMTSAASAAAAAAANDKLTGQRNENSVLFSLSALTDGAKAPENKTTATADGSGLIDIRALSASMGGDGDKKDKGSRVDDIMNLSGGGAFGAALAAPILAPPALETTDAGGAPASGGNNKTLFAILGAGVLIAASIFGGIVVMSKSSTPAEGERTASATSAQPTTTATANEPPPFAAVGTPAPADTGSDTAAPPGTGNATKAAAPAAGGAAKPATGGAVAAAAPKPAAAEPAPAAAPAPAAKPASFGDALAAAAGKPAGDSKPAGGGGGGAAAPFDRGAAAGALGGVNVQSCKKPDGPTGSGHVKVTFAPDGSVSSAVIDGGPFPGTPVGGCIAGKYRGARVPAFSGGPVSVGKSFTIN